MKISSAGRTALWIGCGGFVGLAVGAMLVNPDRAFELSPFWVILLAVYVGTIIGVTRDRNGAKDVKEAKHAKAAAGAPRPALATAPAEALAVRFGFPDVPPGYPAVVGRGEPLHVAITVLGGADPSEGAAVQLNATMGDGTLTGDGIAGNTGEVEFTLEPEGVGELTLHAEAKAGPRAGRASATVSVVDYDVEIERLFGEFRGYAVGVLGPEAHADTARELCDKLRGRADPKTANALLELARIYELVAYGERDADRRLYLALLAQLMVLEEAELPDAPLTREA